MARKQATLIPIGKFMDNASERGQAIAIAKRYERLVQRIIADGSVTTVSAMEHAACRRVLADLVGATATQRDVHDTERPVIQLSLDAPPPDEPSLIRPPRFQTTRPIIGLTNRSTDE